MSDSDFISMLPPSVPVEELARQQGVRPIPEGRDMRLDIWGSDEAFDAFMEDLRASRQADLPKEQAAGRIAAQQEAARLARLAARADELLQ